MVHVAEHEVEPRRADMRDRPHEQDVVVRSVFPVKVHVAECLHVRRGLRRLVGVCLLAEAGGEYGKAVGLPSRRRMAPRHADREREGSRVSRRNRQALQEGVGIGRIGAVTDFLAVVRAVAVGVREERIEAAAIGLLVVGQGVAVGVVRRAVRDRTERADAEHGRGRVREREARPCDLRRDDMHVGGDVGREGGRGGLRRTDAVRHRHVEAKCVLEARHRPCVGERCVEQDPRHRHGRREARRAAEAQGAQADRDARPLRGLGREVHERAGLQRERRRVVAQHAEHPFSAGGVDAAPPDHRRSLAVPVEQPSEILDARVRRADVDVLEHRRRSWNHPRQSAPAPEPGLHAAFGGKVQVQVPEKRVPALVAVREHEHPRWGCAAEHRVAVLARHHHGMAWHPYAFGHPVVAGRERHDRIRPARGERGLDGRVLAVGADSQARDVLRVRHVRVRPVGKLVRAGDAVAVEVVHGVGARLAVHGAVERGRRGRAGRGFRQGHGHGPVRVVLADNVAALPCPGGVDQRSRDEEVDGRVGGNEVQWPGETERGGVVRMDVDGFETEGGVGLAGADAAARMAAFPVRKGVVLLRGRSGRDARRPSAARPVFLGYDGGYCRHGKEHCESSTPQLP